MTRAVLEPGGDARHGRGVVLVLLAGTAFSIAGLVELKQAFAVSAESGPLPLLTGIASAAVVSWLAIDWLLKFLQRHSTWIFVAYRLLFGLGLLVWWSLDAAN